MVLQIARQIEQSEASQLIREISWLYPVLESLHILGIALLFGTTVAIDLRLLGVFRQFVSMRNTICGLLPIAHAGFALVFVTGLMMFTGIAASIVGSSAALWKFSFLVLALGNVLVFHKGVYTRIEDWDTGTTPVAARIAGIISLTSWTGCIFAGRFLAYV